MSMRSPRASRCGSARSPTTAATPSCGPRRCPAWATSSSGSRPTSKPRGPSSCSASPSVSDRSPPAPATTFVTLREEMPPEFALTQDAVDSSTQVVAVRGEIDLFTAPELKTALGEAIEGGKSRIVVDLGETTFLDSTALGVLIGTVKRLRSRDGRLTIVNVDQNIAKTFEITGLDQIFTIRASRDEALAALDEEEASA